MCMIDTQQFLDASRRQVIKVVSLGITISSVIVIFILVAFLLNAPSLSLAVLLAITILDTLGGVLALALLAKRPLWQAVLPLAVVLTTGVTTVSLLLPDMKASVIPLFILVVLLISMAGNARLTMGTMVFCTLLAMAITVMPALPSLTLNLGPALLLFQALAAGVIVVFVWMISDHVATALIRALGFATQRAAEAEAAHAE